MCRAEGPGHSLLIRPVAMKPGEPQIVARRLSEIFNKAPKAGNPKQESAPAATDLSGAWELTIQYEVGSANHKLFLTANKNGITGSHAGWAFEGDLTAEFSGDRVRLRSTLPAGGTQQEMSGDVELGEYSRGKWRARRHTSPA